MTDTAQAQGGLRAAYTGRRASAMASALVGSEILRIAGEIRALAAAGRRMCDLTVGDFDPRQFPIPARLREAHRRRARRGARPTTRRRDGIARAARGGAPLLRARARPRLPGRVRAHRLRRAAGHLRHLPRASWIPATAWSTRCRAGTTTTTSTWCGARGRARALRAGGPLPADARARSRRRCRGARLLCLNSPLNPTGTAIIAETRCAASAEAVVAENAAPRARAASGRCT